jgi:hypothetical protein
VQTQVLPPIAREPDAVDGRVEVEAEGAAADRGAERRRADTGRRACRRVEHVQPQATRGGDELAVGRSHVEPDDPLARSETRDADAGDRPRGVAREEDEPVGLVDRDEPLGGGADRGRREAGGRDGEEDEEARPDEP